MESEQARLERLYHELSDEHLLDLAGDKEDLTGDARLALNKELRERGLGAEVEGGSAPAEAVKVPVQEPELEQGFTPGIPGVFPSSAAMMEQALEPAGEVVAGRTRLISFFDGHELGKACELLEATGITPEIESVAGDAMAGTPPRFDVWIEAGRLERAESLLREKMGLFPLAEETSSTSVAEERSAGYEAGDDDGMRTVAEFESEAEAAQVSYVLQAQGIEARLGDRDVAEDAMYCVQVRAEDQDRALAVVSSALGVR